MSYIREAFLKPRVNDAACLTSRGPGMIFMNTMHVNAGQLKAGLSTVSDIESMSLARQVRFRDKSQGLLQRLHLPLPLSLSLSLSL